MQMRQGLTQCKGGLVRIHLSFEENSQHLVSGHAFWRADLHDVSQSLGMV
jgi:hypothetical protein